MSDFHMFKGGLFGARRNPAWIAQAMEEAAREKQARRQAEQKKKSGGGMGMALLFALSGATMLTMCGGPPPGMMR